MSRHDEIILKGKSVSFGIGIGYAQIIKKWSLEDIRNYLKTKRVTEEELSVAINKTLNELRKIYETIKENKNLAPLVFSHINLLTSKKFQEELKNAIDQIKDAGLALVSVIERRIRIFLKSDDPAIKARADDYIDLLNMIFKHLIGAGEKHILRDVVLVSDVIFPIDILRQIDVIRGIVTIGGSAMAHSSIVAKSEKIPMIIGVKKALDVIKDDDYVIVDAISGRVIINPSSQVLNDYLKARENWEREIKAFLERAKEPAITYDGEYRVRFLANVGREEDIYSAQEHGAEGIGLFRTEFLYMKTTHPPTEEELYRIFRKTVNLFGENPVIIRTLDIGSDKVPSYIKLPKENNPALGLRGVRLYSDILRELIESQIRALLKASIGSNVGIMAPMVADISEAREFKKLVLNLKREVEDEIGEELNVSIGIMLETPAVVFLADKFAREVDFMSIGTNDLTQYILAFDRDCETPLHFVDHAHPAVLRALKEIKDRVKDTPVRISICGEIASDIQVLPLLVGLGYDNLSVNAPSIPLLKYIVRNITLKEAKELVDKALEATAASEVREIAMNYYESTGRLSLPSIKLS